jgi:hypothetical protein
MRDGSTSKKRLANIDPSSTAAPPGGEASRLGPAPAADGQVLGVVGGDVEVELASAQPATAKPPTASLLSAARRVRDYKREGRGLTRQLDISLMATPPTGVYFRAWLNTERSQTVLAAACVGRVAFRSQLRRPT